MEQPLVSFCIPTFNRSRYLASLLEMLVDQLAAFPYPYEVVVSDNASPDDTPQVVAAFADRLPLRSFRHDSNRGSSANWHHVMAQARGTYVVYVADDDALLGDQVAAAIAAMQAEPQIGIAYAPWRLYDLVAQQAQGQFYSQDRDVRVARGDYRGLLDALLRFGAFPEIYICRHELLKQVMPRVPEQAFYAFVHAAEFLQRSQVLLLKEPFYVSITRYFADEQRQQAGTGEAESAWDRYRGGLEHILGRAAPTMGAAERLAFCLRIQELIAQRIAVAVRLRMLAGRDAVETYYLAYRLKALGHEELLHVPLDVLRGQAAIDFLLNDEELNRGITGLLVHGSFDGAVRDYVRKRSQVPVTFVDPPMPARHLSELRNTLVLLHGGDSMLDASLEDHLEAANVRLLTEHALMQKFVA
jgi:poly(ribitol-phosphate) beta-N-acetylglucosaminyltransferase